MMSEHIDDHAAGFVKICEPVSVFPAVHAEREIHIAETDLSEHAGIKHLLEFSGFRHGAPDETDSKEFLRFSDELQHRKRILQIAAERFFAEDVPARGDGGPDALLVTVSRGGDDHRIQIRNSGKLLRSGTDHGSVFFMHVVCGGFLRIINGGDLRINSRHSFQLSDIFRMHISETTGSDNSEFQHFPFSVLVFFNLVTRDTFYYNSFRRIVKTGKQKSNHIFGKAGMQPEHGNETGSGGR